MIYLIRSASYKDKNNRECNEFESILKIGYTKDNGKKSRFGAYITENPTCQVLYLIPKGTEQDEKNLHHYFKKYLKYGQEWFSEDKEILEFFKTHTTKKSLEELKVSHGSKNSRAFSEYRKEKNRLIPELTKKYISKVLSSFQEISNEYIELADTLPKKLSELLDINLDLCNIDTYFKSQYPGIDFSLAPNLSMNILKEIKIIEEDYTNFTDRMRYIYSLDFDSKLIKLILDNLSDSSYSKYYYSISKERAGTLNYQKGNLEKEYSGQKSHILDINAVVSEVKKSFIPGERYSKSDIKEILRKVYESNGYNKTPKASDLEEYFELKSCQITNKETGKLDHGFKIIKIKEGD